MAGHGQWGQTGSHTDILHRQGTRPGSRGGRPGRTGAGVRGPPQGSLSLTGAGCTPGVCAGPEVPDATLADGRAKGIRVAVGWAGLAGPFPGQGLEGALSTG